MADLLAMISHRRNGEIKGPSKLSPSYPCGTHGTCVMKNGGKSFHRVQQRPFYVCPKVYIWILHWNTLYRGTTSAHSQSKGTSPAALTMSSPQESLSRKSSPIARLITRSDPIELEVITAPYAPRHGWPRYRYRASLINRDGDDMVFFSGRSCGKRLLSFSALRFLPASELVSIAKPSSHPTHRCLARQKALVPSCVFIMCRELIIIRMIGLDYSCSWMGHGRRSRSLGLRWNFRRSYQSCGRHCTFRVLICLVTPLPSGHISLCHIQGLSMEKSSCKCFGLHHIPFNLIGEGLHAFPTLGWDRWGRHCLRKLFPRD